MRTHLRIGRLLGVPIGLNWGVLVVCVLLALSLAQVSLPSVSPDYPTSAYWFAAIIGVLGFLVSLTGHELGHSYIAGRNDVRVVEITLWLFGGVAKLEGDADNPGAEFRIAAAGPAMSMVMAGVFGGAWWWVDRWEGSAVLTTTLLWLSLINVVLAVSNLLPAFPLDGGRMLPRRAVAALGPQDRSDAHRGVVGPAPRRRADRLGAGDRDLVVVLVRRVDDAACALPAARRSFGMEGRARRGRSSMIAPVSGLGRVLPPPLRPNDSVARLEELLVSFPGVPLVPVIDERGHVSMLVLPDAVMRVPPAQRGVVPISSLVEPMWSLPRVHPDECVEAVIARLGPGRYWRAVVTDGTDVQGVLCSEDVDRVVELATV